MLHLIFGFHNEMPLIDSWQTSFSFSVLFVITIVCVSADILLIFVVFFNLD